MDREQKACCLSIYGIYITLISFSQISLWGKDVGAAPFHLFFPGAPAQSYYDIFFLFILFPFPGLELDTVLYEYAPGTVHEDYISRE